MIERIEPLGRLIADCPFPGETRADDVWPAHPNAIQVSQDRFLVVYATRGYRGGDDDLSIVYQLRAGALDGPVLAERMVASTRNDWEPFGDGAHYVLQNGHPAAFGVPRGALIGGKPAPNANLFVIKWHYLARYLDPDTGILISNHDTPGLMERTLRVGWTQLRLNDAADDLEIVAPAQQLRQIGYETGESFCSAPITNMNNTFTHAIPFNDDCTEWLDFHHMDGHIAAIKYRYNLDRGLYEWVEIGPLLGGDIGVGEASVARYGSEWVIASRPSVHPDTPGAPAVWMRTSDPFGIEPPQVFRPPSPLIKQPLTVYTMGDGQLRLFTGDETISPYNYARNPLYLWDIDPDNGFTASNRRVVFDTFEYGIPIPPEGLPRCDFGHLFPHPGGSVQLVAHRMLGSYFNDARVRGRAITAAEKEPAGIYYDAIHYTESHPNPWHFAPEN